jgi:ATP-dependent DNA helicase DinG
LILDEVFAADGALAERLPGFTYRAAQEQMAALVVEALTSGRHAVIEAGTGIGKTFAYLLPVLLLERRAIVSTGTHTLQDQLFSRDLPLLGAVIGRPMQVAVLKGRSNYLCWHRLDAALHAGTHDGATLSALRGLMAWGQTSDSGDLTELEDLAEDHALKAEVTSTVENCLGRECEFFDRCFVLEARRRAQTADVVIVNHHLLLADLSLKDSGFGELLPGTDAVIVDEAHQLPDVAQQFFGWSIGTRELESLARDVFAAARSGGVLAQLDASLSALARATVAMRAAAGRAERAERGRTPWIAAPAALRDALPEAAAALEALGNELTPVAESSAGLRNCAERCGAYGSRLRELVVADTTEGLRWFDLGGSGVAAHWTPLDVGTALAARIEAQNGVWVFASATLAVGEDFSHYLRRIGLRTPLTGVLPSPFDYEKNARLFVPQGLPDPADERYVESLLAAIWPLVEAARGGAFLLFTSYRALQRAQAWIEGRPVPGPVLVQGRGSRSDLLTQFRADGNAILLGTGSFWQGVDVRGRALRLVVIDKLPFAVPSDPLIQARAEAIRREGGDPFHELSLPQAVLALKQGVGRLIRDFDDRGLIVIGDPRVRTRNYGAMFLRSLPAMPFVEDFDEALDFARSLAEPAANPKAARAV